MFCPRCGRQVSDTANFCGGCGLPRADIVKANAKPVTESEVRDVHETISQLEDDLSGLNPVTDYTTDFNTNSNTEDKSFVQMEMENEGADEHREVPQYEYKAPEYRPEEDNDLYTRNTTVYESSEETRVSTTDFVIMILLSSIPIIGLIYLFYQAFGQKTNSTKRSYARAVLLLGLFGLVTTMAFSFGIAMSLV